MNVKVVALAMGAVALGLIGVVAGAYGAFGTAVVSADWLSCQSMAMASLASLPDCRTIPWPSQFGIGIALLLVAVVALASAWWLVRRARASRDIQQS